MPRRHPRALVTGRRALSLLLCGQMWALLRKPAAGRSQRAGLVKRRGWGCTGRGRCAGVRGFPEGLVHTGLVQWAAPTRSRTISAVIRPAREDGGEAGRGGSGVGANQPSGWITRSDHAARRPHSCRRLPQFHQLETPGKATGRGGQGRAGRACRCKCNVGPLSEIEMSTLAKARVQWPRENNADLTSSSDRVWGWRGMCMAREMLGRSCDDGCEGIALRELGQRVMMRRL